MELTRIIGHLETWDTSFSKGVHEPARPRSMDGTHGHSPASHRVGNKLVRPIARCIFWTTRATPLRLGYLYLREALSLAAMASESRTPKLGPCDAAC